MATAKTNYLEKAVIDHILGEGARNMTSPATLFVSLHTADPTEAGNGAEVSGNGYSRQAVNFGAASVNNDGTVANTGALTFTASGGGWGSVGWMAIWDASSAGNCLYYGAITGGAQTINDGNTVTMAVGAIVVGEL